MTGNWLRRVLVAVSCASAALLAACGSSTIESALTPSRIIAFGDGFSDLGERGPRYTVNDGSVNIWTQQLASRYGITLTTASAGGLSYARGNARITVKPDAAGDATTLTVTEQVSAFLASGTIGQNDVFLISGGIADIISEMAAVNAGTQTSAQMTANVRQAGRDLGAQVRRLVDAGARYVVVVGPYNLGRSPWAASIGQTGFLQDVTNRFNEEMLVSVVDLGARVLYVDAAFYFNLVTAVPSNYDLTNGNTAVCNSVDPGPGIGIGAGQVNSSMCNANTIISGADYRYYVFADSVYMTPQAQSLFGDYAYDRLRERW